MGTVLHIPTKIIGRRNRLNCTCSPIWLYVVSTKIKMCTYGIDHTSNKYYSSVMFMRTIFCLRQGQDEPTESYYRSFEAAISTSYTEKWTAMTHMELNRTQIGAMTKKSPIFSRICASSCWLIPNNSQVYGMIWRKIPFWVRKITQRSQPPHIKYCVGTRIQHNRSKHTHHPGRWHLSIIMTQA